MTGTVKLRILEVSTNKRKQKKKIFFGKWDQLSKLSKGKEMKEGLKVDGLCEMELLL